MKFKLFIALFILTTFVAGIAYAASSAGGAGGIRYRQEKLIDPYSRAKYFGLNYTKPLYGFGAKDAVSGGKAKGNFGAKGVGGVRNKLYNSLISKGRNPNIVSHYDSGWKGSKNIDTVVYLNSPLQIFKDDLVSQGVGFVRIISQEYSQNANLPYSEIYVTVAIAPPSNRTELMGAWLVDEDTGYTFHLGNFMVSTRGSGSLSYRMYQYVGAYDQILLTREPMEPEDPFPHEPVLLGDIKK